MTLTAAARVEGIDPRTIRKVLGNEITEQNRATKSDRKRRDMLVPTSRGVIPVVIKGSEQASLLGRYMSAVGKFLRDGDADGLDEFGGMSISDHPLITDPDVLSSLAHAGALDLDRIYK